MTYSNRVGIIDPTGANVASVANTALAGTEQGLAIRTASAAPDLSTTANITANGQTVVLNLTGGSSDWNIGLAGTFSAGTTVTWEGTVDGTNWTKLNGRVAGSLISILTNTTSGGSGPLLIRGNGAALLQFRVRCTAFQAGDNVAVTIRSSIGTGAVFLNATPQVLVSDGTRTASLFYTNAGNLATPSAPSTGELRVHLEGHQLFSDTFDTGLDTVNRWNAGVAAGGGVAASGSPGTVTLASGTTANGYSYLQSQPSFPPANPGFLQIFNSVSLPSPFPTSVYMSWGVGTVPATPTAAAPATNAVLFEINATTQKMFAVCYAAGVRNVIQDLSAATGNGSQPTDTAPHKYYIFFRGDNIFWAIDSYSNVVATIATGALGPVVNTLPLLEMAIAGTATPSSSGVLSLNSVYVSDDTCNNAQLSDGTYPWRKATIKVLGAAPVTTDLGLLTISAPIDGAKASYSASFASLAIVSGATDFFTIYGSATKTIRVTQIGFSVEATVITNAPVALIKRSAVNSGGASTNPGAIPHDSTDAAGTATVLGYTGNPASLGTAVGTIRAERVNAPTAGGGSPGSQVIFDFGIRPAKAPVLRGTTQGLALNLGATAITGGAASVWVEWTEE